MIFDKTNFLDWTSKNWIVYCKKELTNNLFFKNDMFSYYILNFHDTYYSFCIYPKSKESDKYEPILALRFREQDVGAYVHLRSFIYNKSSWARQTQNDPYWLYIADKHEKDTINNFKLLKAKARNDVLKEGCISVASCKIDCSNYEKTNIEIQKIVEVFYNFYFHNNYTD